VRAQLNDKYVNPRIQQMTNNEPKARLPGGSASYRTNDLCDLLQGELEGSYAYINHLRQLNDGDTML